MIENLSLLPLPPLYTFLSMPTFKHGGWLFPKNVELSYAAAVVYKWVGRSIEDCQAKTKHDHIWDDCRGLDCHFHYPNMDGTIAGFAKGCFHQRI